MHFHRINSLITSSYLRSSYRAVGGRLTSELLLMCSLATGICSHSDTTALVKSNTDQLSAFQFRQVSDEVRARQFLTTNWENQIFMVLPFYTIVYCHVETGKGKVQLMPHGWRLILTILISPFIMISLLWN